MALRTHISDLKQDVALQLPLNGEVVLLRVLGAEVGLKFAEQQNWPEGGPIHRLAAGRIQNAVKRIGVHCSILQCKRSVEQRIRQEGTAAEGRFSAELL